MFEYLVPVFCFVSIISALSLFFLKENPFWFKFNLLLSGFLTCFCLFLKGNGFY